MIPGEGFAVTGKALLRAFAILSLALVALVPGGATVSAQEPERGETVTTRARPELDPRGARIGGFLLYPCVVLGEEFNDNIFAVDDDLDADFITTITPGVRLRSDWNNHALNFDGSATIGRYFDHEDENYEDYRVGVDGRLDIRRNINASALARYSKLHEERSSPDDERGKEPTEFSVTNYLLSYFHRFNRIAFDVDGTADMFDFDDVETLTGVRNEDDRDRTIVEGTVRVGYEIVPEYEAFVRGSVNSRRYDESVDDLGLDRDSTGYEIVAGTAIDFSGVTFGDVFAGFTSQDFDDNDLQTVSGITFGGEMIWNVTGLTTLTGSITRTIEEVTTSRASGRFTTRLGITADHELLRNLLLDAGVFGTRREFEGIDRDENDLEFGLGAKYLMNRNIYASLNYDFHFRDTTQSGGGGRDFLINAVTLRIQTQF